MSHSSFIALTGGPGGGKTTLIEELAHDSAWAGRFAALPEAIVAMRYLGISVREKLFQRVMVYQQMAMEEALERALDPQDRRIILCHRGALDPLAYWLVQGWSQDEFFTYTKTTCADHYRRYSAVLHLVTAADGALEHYRRWPGAERHEPAEQAVRLDGLLHQVWRDHPHYYRVGNEGRDWAAKAQEARAILERYLPND